MNNLTVVDGDFLFQLRRNLDASTFLSDPAYDLRVLQTNRYAVYQTHLDFLRAGARIIRTNTSRATSSCIHKYLKLSGADAKSIVLTAVELAQKAVFKYYEETGGDASNVEEFKKHRPLVAGYCGSYAVMLKLNKRESRYWYETSERDIAKCHRMRMQILLNAGVDLLALERIPCKMEAEVLIDMLRQFRTARVWMTFVCRNEMQLMDGSSFLDIALYCYQSLPGQIIAIGMMGPDLETEIVAFENVCLNKFNIRLPMLMYFNDWFGQKRRSAMHCVREAMSFGTLYISGSSESTAKDIQILRDAVKECYNSPGPSSIQFKRYSLQNEENKSKL